MALGAVLQLPGPGEAGVADHPRGPWGLGDPQLQVEQPCGVAEGTDGDWAPSGHCLRHEMNSYAPFLEGEL